VTFYVILYKIQDFFHAVALFMDQGNSIYFLLTYATAKLPYILINSAILRGCREPLAPCRIPKAEPLAGCGTASHYRSSALKKVNF
jgi:hypothetical protein